VWLSDGEDMITRFDTIDERDRQTDRRTYTPHDGTACRVYA